MLFINRIYIYKFINLLKFLYFKNNNIIKKKLTLLKIIL